jgi:hypothetical protein
VNIHCSHCDPTASFKEPLTSEQQAAFLHGELADGLSVLVCQGCWTAFKNESEKLKAFDWGGCVTVVTFRKPQPIAGQPLDKLW